MVNFVVNFAKKPGGTRWVMPVVFVLLSILFWGAGCGKKGSDAEIPVVVTNRIADAAYLEELKALRGDQEKLARTRNVVVSRMNEKVAAVKARLPKGATDAQVKAELEKDEAWRALFSENEKCLEEVQSQLARARESVRKRLAREAADKKAVLEGRARVAE